MADTVEDLREVREHRGSIIHGLVTSDQLPPDNSISCDALIRCAETEMAKKQTQWFPTRLWEPCILKISGNIASVFLENSPASNQERSFDLACTRVESHSVTEAEKVGLPNDDQPFCVFECSGVLLGQRRQYESVVLCAIGSSADHWIETVMRNAVKAYRTDIDTAGTSRATTSVAPKASTSCLGPPEIVQQEKVASNPPLPRPNNEDNLKLSVSKNARSSLPCETPTRPSWSWQQQFFSLGLLTSVWIVLECAAELTIPNYERGSKTFSISPLFLSQLMTAAFLLGRDSVWAQGEWRAQGGSTREKAQADTKSQSKKKRRKMSFISILSPVIRQAAGSSNDDDDEEDNVANEERKENLDTDDEDNDESWRTVARTTTVAPLANPDDANRWSEPPGDVFWLRGLNYLKDKEKYQSRKPVFPLLGCDLWRAPAGANEGKGGPMSHISRHPQSFVKKLERLGPSIIHDEKLQAHFCGKDGEDFHVFVVNFMMPWGNFVAYYLRPQTNITDNEEDNEGLASAKRVMDLYERFAFADDQFRNLRLKMTPRVVEGPWLVRKAVGKGNKAAKLAEHIELTYHREVLVSKGSSTETHSHDNDTAESDPEVNLVDEPQLREEKVKKGLGKYLEVEVNVSNSAVGNSILSVVAGYMSCVSIDLGMVIEGVEERELPERILGALRFHKLDINAPFLPPWKGTDDEDIGPSSQSTTVQPENKSEVKEGQENEINTSQDELQPPASDTSPANVKSNHDKKPVAICE